MIIPVRVASDSPLTTVGRVYDALPEEHPLAARPCPVCDGSLTAAPVTLVFVGIDPEIRAEGKSWCTGAAVAVHAACAGVDPTGEQQT